MLNKKSFIDMISESTGKTKKEVDEAVDYVLEGIKQAVQYYDGVKFIGFGTFDVAKRKARIGHNPGTLEKVEISACKAPHFSPSKLFKESLNYA